MKKYYLFLAGFACLISLLTPLSYAWNNTWANCTNVNFTETLGVNRWNESIRINITLVGKQINSSDIRLVNSSCSEIGANVNFQNLWNNTNDIMIGFIMPSMAASTSVNYSVLWGNVTSVPAVSTDIFLYFDTFNRPDSTTIGSEGGNSVTWTECEADGTANISSNRVKLASGAVANTDAGIGAAILSTSGNIFYTGRMESSAASLEHGWQIHNNAAPCTLTGTTLALNFYSDNTIAYINSGSWVGSGVGWSAGRNYSFKVHVDNTNAKINYYYDSDTLLASNKGLTGNQISMKMWTGGTNTPAWYFDEFVVCKQNCSVYDADLNYTFGAVTPAPPATCYTTSSGWLSIPVGCALVLAITEVFNL